MRPTRLVASSLTVVLMCVGCSKKGLSRGEAAEAIKAHSRWQMTVTMPVVLSRPECVDIPKSGNVDYLDGEN